MLIVHLFYAIIPVDGGISGKNIRIMKSFINQLVILCFLGILTTGLNSCQKQMDHSITPPSLTNGLVAYYPFEGNADDSSGYKNNGIVYGAILTNGKLGDQNGAYRFDGSTNQINLPNPFMNGTTVNQFCIYSRFKTFGSGVYCIWGKTKFWGEINLVVEKDNSIALFWASSDGGYTYSTVKSDSNTVRPNEWNDVAINFSNSKLSIYVNDIPVNSNQYYTKQDGTLISNAYVNSVADFGQDANSSKFGVETVNGVLTNYFYGIIDEFRLYNRPLTDSEIKYLVSH
ncbi:MAG TPA: LamG domain-containing protein [Chitinophagaceae bacterium]